MAVLSPDVVKNPSSSSSSSSSSSPFAPYSTPTTRKQQQRRLSAPELAWQHDLVITTFPRLSAEWGRRRSPDPARGCPLLCVHWLRVVVDEGHLLSASSASSSSASSASSSTSSSSSGYGGAITSKMQMACALKAERRWVLTGTPAPGRAGSGGGGNGDGDGEKNNADGGCDDGSLFNASTTFFSHSPSPHLPNLRPGYSGASALAPLLAFLKHNPYEHRRRLDAGIVRPFESGSPWGALALRDLLLDVSIRAAKRDLSIIPRLIRVVTPVRFRRSHAISYNALVEAVERALLLADWGDPDHRESLLNSRRNAPWAREVAANLRAAACVAGAIELHPKLADVHETLQLMAERHGLERPAEDLASGPPWLASRGHPLRRVEAALLLRGGGAKPPERRRSGEDGKFSSSSSSSAAAAAAAAVAAPSPPPPPPPRFRRGETACDRCSLPCRLPLATPCACLLCVECAAPSRERCAACGTNYEMQSVSDPARNLTNPNPKWPVPIEVIEWQPSYAQRGALGASGGHWSPAWATTKSSKVAHLVARLVEYGIAPPPPPKDGDGGRSGVVGGLNAGGGAGGENARPPSFGTFASTWTPRAKAIVFSQHWPHILLVTRALDAAKARSVTLQGRLPPAQRAAAVDEFRHDDLCGVLVMDTSGAVGLDLSFARFVFVMDPIADGALEAQVVSRAHRMGARSEVVVETLVMEGTAEEEVMRLSSASSSNSISSSSSPGGKSPSAAARRGKKPRLNAAGGRGKEKEDEEQEEEEEEQEEEEEDVSAAARLRARVLLSVRRVPVPEAEGSDEDDDEEEEEAREAGNDDYERGVAAANAAAAAQPATPGGGWRSAGSATAAAAAAAAAAARAAAAVASSFAAPPPRWSSGVANSAAAAAAAAPAPAAAPAARHVRFASAGGDGDGGGEQQAPAPPQRRTVRFAD